MTRSTPFRTALAAVLAAGLLAACAPGSGVDTGGGDPEPGTEVNTDPASMGDVTLSVWDQEVRGGQNEQMEQLNTAFEEAYPNITLERNSQSFDDLEKTLRLAISGDDAPDVVQANNGRGSMGAFVAGDLLTSLQPYADVYGWTDRFPQSVLQYSTYSDDAKTFGEGNVYGLPQVGEVVGVFYSKPKLAELGIETPATWADFEAALETAEEAGELPIQLGNVDGWPAGHVFGPIQGTTTAPQDVTALGLGNDGASWETPENTEAAQTMADWAEAGYFGDGANGKDYDAAWADFAKGTGVFLIGGSWLAADLGDAMGEDVGFIAPPPVEEGGPLRTTGGTGLPFAVTSASENPDAAAAYIDFITNEDAMGVLAETGNMPVLNTADHAPEGGVNADVFAAFGEVTDNGALLPYLDYATPTMGDTLNAACQDLIAGQTDPAGFTKTLQADYGDFVESNR